MREAPVKKKPGFTTSFVEFKNLPIFGAYEN